jgi:alcohol dehydrogenase
MQPPQTSPIIRPSPDLQSLPGSRVHVLFQPGGLAQLGELCRENGASRALLVTDPGIVEAGHVERAMRSLYKAGVVTRLYDGVGENPTTDHVHRGLALARKFEVDFVIGLGGGSSMDCAKGVNFLLTNGGRMQDYWGVNKAAKPLLPLIAIPTTAGTGSEAQSAALITDPETHAKMACWDEKAAAKIAILDAELTATQPRKVAAATGIDAISHAVETAGCTKRTDASRAFSKAAWGLLSAAFVRSLEDPADAQAREKMLLGAHLAGCAIENSMLGAAHACANPLTAAFGIVHGHAVGVMLPHVVRYNSANGQLPYADLEPNPETLAARLTSLLTAGHIPDTLRGMSVDPAALPDLAGQAAKQWTAAFNPRKVGPAELAEIYRAALG